MKPLKQRICTDQQFLIYNPPYSSMRTNSVYNTCVEEVWNKVNDMTFCMYAVKINLALGKKV